MFLENKYTKIYWALIEKRKKELLNKSEGYFEKHHIIPKSLGGSEEESNLILLTPREHFIAHLCLSKMTVEQHKIKMYWALHRMAYSSIDRFSSRNYEWFRNRHVTFLKENHHSKRIENWSDIMSKAAYEQWENNENRRLQTSERLKTTWKIHREKLIEHNRSISKKGAQASRLVVSKKIEYKGHIYVGWSELHQKTGISKHLYNKYYLNGKDPCDRINANGPIPK